MVSALVTENSKGTDLGPMLKSMFLLFLDRKGNNTGQLLFICITMYSCH